MRITAINMKNKNISVKEELNQFLLYTAPTGQVKVEVLFSDESIWASQKMLAELFGVDVRTISEHLQNIFKSQELHEESVIRNFRITAADGKKYDTKFYNLDAIISVGYRVNSTKATQFRIWATERLREYIIKGFTMDDDRLKNGRYFGKDYFRELLERIRSIRSSERRIYLQITDIFQECSIDYDPNSLVTKDFFATVQNKFHFAITGKTAAEIIHEKSDRSKKNMGLTTWKSAPHGRVLKSDVLVAKNYLSEQEIKKLERTISAFFDYVESVIERRNAFTMELFIKSVEKFLLFHEYKILKSKGAISAEHARQKAIDEYQDFNKNQDILNDFEKEVLKKLEIDDSK